MMRRTLLISAVPLLAAACVEQVPTRIGADGRPVPVIYRITQADLPRIQVRMLDSVNVLRAQAGVPPLQLNAALNAAAATHSRDMSFQGRPWLFGSDGTSPVTRAQRAGYGGRLVGELISETFETELETLTAWMADRDSRAVVLDPGAREMGFGFYQEANGKLWWTLSLGNPFDRNQTPNYIPQGIPGTPTFTGPPSFTEGS